MARLALIPDGRRAFETSDRRLFVQQIESLQTNLLRDLVENAAITPSQRAVLVAHKNELEALKSVPGGYDRVDVPERPTI